MRDRSKPVGWNFERSDDGTILAIDTEGVAVGSGPTTRSAIEDWATHAQGVYARITAEASRDGPQSERLERLLDLKELLAVSNTWGEDPQADGA